MPDGFIPHAAQWIASSAKSDSGWSVRVIRAERGSLFGAPRVEAPRRFRYIAITLEYVYRGAAQAELYPDTVALVHIGPSPLQGLSQSPLLFFDEDRGEAHRLNEEPIAIAVEADRPQCATFVYEFHQDCREFRLYFPGCEGMALVVEARPGADI